jgi:hypothetical protein
MPPPRPAAPPTPEPPAPTRRRAAITQSVKVFQGQGLVWATPKTHERRDVPIPRFLIENLRRTSQAKIPTSWCSAVCVAVARRE